MVTLETHDNFQVVMATTKQIKKIKVQSRKMAFRFSWPEFDHEFYKEAKSQLEAAMNKGNKPSVIVDHITVKELNMGTKPPELEILEIGELGNDKFRGIFKLTYAGDAYIEIQTKVQANPMHAKVLSDLPRHSRPSVLAADQPLVVPMILRISDLKLRGIVVLVVSKQKGVTLVFKNDPLESIRVSSTFDCVSILRDFLQRQIEAQLRNLLQEDLPTMIHNLSTRYIQSEERKKEEQDRQLKLERQQSLTSTPVMLQRFRSNTSVSSCPELDTYSMGRGSISSGSSSVYTPIEDDYSSVIHTFPDTKMTSAPMTAANLFCHNRQYQLGIHPLVSKPYHHPRPAADAQSETEFSLISDIYANDADAPWYAIEGPDLNVPYNVDFFQDPVTLSPSENTMAAQLSRLTNINHTLSPLTETISHFTFRSLPHVTKPTLIKRKVPKRRVTRLNMSAPRL